MFNALDISTSALAAQRTRFNTISSNIANVSTTRNEAGERAPYQARKTIFQADDSIGGRHGAVGVKVSKVLIEDSEPKWRPDPTHEDAVPEGQPHAGEVAYPNINVMTEFTDALDASRAYEANLSVIDVTKDLHQQSLRILA